MLPDRAIFWPVLTTWPTFTLTEDRWAYWEYVLFPCLITTALPYAGPSPAPLPPAFTTVPPWAATTGVPVGTA